MKDAKGHGSNAHGSGIGKIPGVVQVHPNALRVITKNPMGASVKPQTGLSPTNGYMVSLQGRTAFPSAAELGGAHGSKIISAFSRANADKLNAPDMHIGSWSDGEKVHLDVSQNIPDRTTAIRAGRAQNQQGIWDVARKKFIATGGTGD